MKISLKKSTLSHIDRTFLFFIEYDPSDVAVLATFNYNGCPVSFMSRALSGRKILYPVIGKVATEVFETVESEGIS